MSPIDEACLLQMSRVSEDHEGNSKYHTDDARAGSIHETGDAMV